MIGLGRAINDLFQSFFRVIFCLLRVAPQPEVHIILAVCATEQGNSNAQ